MKYLSKFCAFMLLSMVLIATTPTTASAGDFSRYYEKFKTSTMVMVEKARSKTSEVVMSTKQRYASLKERFAALKEEWSVSATMRLTSTEREHVKTVWSKVNGYRGANPYVVLTDSDRIYKVRAPRTGRFLKVVNLWDCNKFRPVSLELNVDRLIGAKVYDALESEDYVKIATDYDFQCADDFAGLERAAFIGKALLTIMTAL